MRLNQKAMQLDELAADNEDEIEELRETMEKLKTKIGNGVGAGVDEKRLTNIETSINTIKRQNKNLEKRVDDYEDNIDQLTNDIDDQHSMNLQLETKFLKEITTQDEFKKRISILEREKEERAKQDSKFKINVDKLEAKIEELQNMSNGKNSPKLEVEVKKFAKAKSPTPESKAKSPTPESGKVTPLKQRAISGNTFRGKSHPNGKECNICF